MASPVVLPTLSWGDPRASRQALLVHGLGSTGALMWRLGTALADAGWSAVAVDLRGHGDAPRALEYTLAAYAADVAATRPWHGGGWDLVVGHSLGGAAATVAAADDGGWTSRLILLDPAIHLAAADRERIRGSQTQAFAEPTAAAVRAEHPGWHEHDVELKADAARRTSVWAVAQTDAQNPDWDVRAWAHRLVVPTHVIRADPSVDSILGDALVAELATNPVLTVSTVTGAGHSPQRDAPDETVRQLLAALH